jgi:hypothetical protein
MARDNLFHDDSASAALPDLRLLFGGWDAINTQLSRQQTDAARQALLAGLRACEQSVSNAGAWMQAWGSSVQRLSELVRATEQRADAAEDLAGLWNLELGLIGDSAQMAAAFGQDSWIAWVQSQSALMQTALMQGSQQAERALRAVGSAAPTIDEAPVPLPLLGALPASGWIDAWNQAAQSAWDSVTAAGNAAVEAATSEPPQPEQPAQRPRKRAR